ncbi:MAG: class I SAM-dependent methyltransferase [Candidatus Curtissbacteria bacterium]|nr:class I SAM-dependent methyltransferase [Candidatus Curtissbacteria bacterium]
MVQLLVAILLLIIMLLLLMIIVGFFFFLFDIFLELPYVATKRHKIDTIIKFAQIKPGQTVVDLGAGDGRLLIASAQKGANAIGYEINPFLILITRIRAHFLSLRSASWRRSSLKRGDHHGHQDDLAMTGKVIVYKSNLWRADLAVADVVFVYGRRKTMQKFQDFVYKNARSGTRVIVNTNPFPNKKYVKSENGIFLYKI